MKTLDIWFQYLVAINLWLFLIGVIRLLIYWIRDKDLPL